ncbi:ATP-dependent Clp protease, ATP-binding subunit [Arthrobacter sp. PAMC 25486]|uniref:Clp protease N-terminal domain-containing protein n=1 Tax=Arthrobacter sp. PAMC 25486 TaxID=1494608 RepID=UPI000536153F|nr:Clp protease N-terminal domain-containing protein [Arthrobacter sp. PAMC 25486]AIY00245.1 ATP-dependent Clp protease, ATP-binding subunit [Arthrobacter sp. PAMC 25486]
MSSSLDISNPAPLDDLISALVRSHDSVLEQLSGAMLVSEHLGAVSDHLIGHFVDQARRSGASWSDIGRSMGVTKQAAQKRFVTKASGEQPDLDASQGFSRFTEHARNVVVAAQNEAHAVKNISISPEHLVLGLLAGTDTTAVRALAAQHVPLEAMRQAAAGTLAAPADTVPSLVPFAADTQKVLQLSFREALRLGHNHVGSGHLLLALLEHENGAGVLADAGVDRTGVEDFVTAELARESAAYEQAAAERA